VEEQALAAKASSHVLLSAINNTMARMANKIEAAKPAANKPLPHMSTPVERAPCPPISKPQQKDPPPTINVPS